MYGIAVDDFDGDGKKVILVGGNFYQSKPQVGIYDASYGTFLKGDGQGNFTSLPAQQSGINITGAIRDMTLLKVNKNKTVLVASNNEALMIIKQNQPVER